MLEERSYHLSDAAKVALGEYVELRRQQPLFANARSIRNALDRAVMRHASRQVSRTGPVPIADLMTLDEADILSSRVFEDAATNEAVDGQ